MFPVSVKGVVVRDDRVLLLRNERDEWELPGGKIEVGETPEGCLVREVEEETGWPVKVGEILDSWIYHITQVDRHVFIVTYGCYVDSQAPVVVSNEHKEAGLFTREGVSGLPMPDNYKASILAWFARSNAWLPLQASVDICSAPPWPPVRGLFRVPSGPAARRPCRFLQVHQHMMSHQVVEHMMRQGW